MGIIQSAIRFLADLTDERENQRPRSNPMISSPNYYHDQNTSMIVNDKVKASPHVFIKENITPQNAPLRTSTFQEKVEAKDQRKERTVVVVAPPPPPPAQVGIWIKHYSSCHRILLVGEGDFSFSISLATAFLWTSNMIATSLDSLDFLMENYENAFSNIIRLSLRNCSVMHEIDATTMANHPLLGDIKFDRIVFNFPFAGFFNNMSRQFALRRHRRLVSSFLKNAKEMISENGEIHITHKTNGFHKEWNVESIASSHRLRLIEAVDFNHLDYPGYNTKYGFGGDKNFNCYPSKTYKFGINC